MRVLIVVSAFPTISETFIVRHALGVSGRGVEVWVLAVPGDTRLLDAAGPSGADLKRRLAPIPQPSSRGVVAKIGLLASLPPTLRSARLLGLRLMDQLAHRSAISNRLTLAMPRALIGKPRFDVVHAQHGRSALSAARLIDAGFLQGPLVVTFHGTDLNAKRKRRNRELYAPVWRTAELCTVGSEFMASRLRQAGLSESDFRVLPVGVDVDRYHRARPWRPQPPNRLLFIGRLAPVKGAEYALRAMRLLAQRGVEATLDIVGGGELLEPLRALSRDLDIEQRVVFHGPLPPDQVRSLLERTTLLVHPGIVDSRGAREAQGLVLAEASAMEVPVVASNLGGIPESIQDGVTGLLVPEKQPEAIADAVEQLLRDPEKARRMGAEGRRFAVEKFDQNRIIDAWIGIYNGLVGSGAPV